MRLLSLTTLLLLSACSAATPAAPATPRPTTPPTLTTAPVPTATPKPDYSGMRGMLLQPLGGLIVAMRDGSGVQFQVDAFEKAAREVEPRVATDVSPNGNRLHSVIANTRHGIQTKNLEELESARRLLLEVTN